MSALDRTLTWRAAFYGALVPLGIVMAVPSFAEEAEPAPAAAEAVDSVPAAAEQARPAPAAPGGVEEIVVTRARRREENLQTVPIPISAFSGDFLDKTGTWNIVRLSELQPSLQFYASNPRNTGFNIRGLGSPFGLTNDGIEPGVGLYVDDVFYARPASTSFDFIDLEQVDVLRGPQGTLYGKNTTAGAINLRTRAPSFDFGGRGEITYGRFGFVQAKTSLTGPIYRDKLAGRFSFTTTQREGTVTNVLTDTDVNDQNNFGFRGALLWVPSDDLKVTFAGDYNRQRLECCTQVAARVAPTLRNPNRQFFGIIEDLGYTPPSLNAFDRITDVDSDLQANQELGGASINLNWELGGGTLTSVSAWRFWRWDPSNDRDFIGLPVTTLSQNPSAQDQWSQEFRYASSLTLPELPFSIGRNVEYVGGIFAFNQSIDSSGTQEQGSAASRFLLAPGPNVTPELLDGLRANDDISLDTTSIAGFGQATWHATERLSFTPGLRLNYDSKSGSFDRRVSGGLQTDDPALKALQDSILAPQTFDVDFDEFNVSGQVTIGYSFLDELFGFATYARNFKTGGVNIAGVPNRPDGTPATEVAEIDPESVDHFEVGLKSTLLDGILKANLTLFQTEIQDYQTQVVNDQVGVLRGFLANAERVRVRGIEADVSGRPHENVDFYVNAAYTDGEYRDFEDAPCPIELTGGPSVCNASGQDLPGVPEWATSFGAEYHVPTRLSVLPGEAYLGIDASYQSGFSSNPTPSKFMMVDDRTVVNFRGGYRSDDGRWEIFGWVRNAFNENYFEFLSPVSGNSGLIVGQLGDPRTYGLTLRANF